MEFDQFDKRTATERLQLYEDALVVYALLYKIKDSPYMYLFKDQIALMKISMIIPLDSIKYEVTCESSIEINVDSTRMDLGRRIVERFHRIVGVR